MDDNIIHAPSNTVNRFNLPCGTTEESDMYGFSVISNFLQQRSSHAIGCLRQMCADENWNNDESINLMAAAYGINGDCQYKYSLFNNPFIGRELNFDHLSLKADQGVLFAQRLVLRGTASFQTNQFHESAKNFQEAVRFDPGSIVGYIGLTKVLLALGDRAGARRACATALDLAGDDALLHGELDSLQQQLSQRDTLQNIEVPSSSSARSVHKADDRVSSPTGVSFLEKLRQSLSAQSLPARMLVADPRLSADKSAHLHLSARSSSDSSEEDDDREHKKRRKSDKHGKKQHKEHKKDKKKKKHKKHRRDS